MKIGLALSGGGTGLQSLAYIGVIKALNDSGIKIDFISGSGSGSIFASLYALNYAPDEMKELVDKYYDDFTKIEKGKIRETLRNYLIENQITTEGLINGNKIESIINKVVENRQISNVELPLAITTVDMISTKECMFLSKKYNFSNENIDYIYNISIAKAIRASISFPGIYTNCIVDKYNLVNAKIKNILPVKILKDMGAEYTIGISFDNNFYKPSKNVVENYARLTDIYAQKDMETSEKLADIVIKINTNKTNLIETNEVDKFINSGYDEMRKYVGQIKRA